MREVILLGQNARRAGGPPEEWLERAVPVLSTWQAADLVDNEHRNYYGRPGIWGTRLANKVLANAERVHPIGTRMSVWAVGYDFDFSKCMYPPAPQPDDEWTAQCERWRDELPVVESPLHDDPSGGIHPWRFTEALQQFFRPDECIVTDMGTPLVAAHQILRLRPPQRLMTSGGLGEMGVALPAAVGASFARDKGQVLCLHCDGGMMMNLQELQTILHHRLPVKIIVYENQGYQMLKDTQDGAGYERSGVEQPDVSFPSYVQLAYAWGIAAGEVRTWAHFQRLMPAFFETKEPALIVYHFPPTPLLPKLLPIRNSDGTITSPAFDDLSPRL